MKKYLLSRKHHTAFTQKFNVSIVTNLSRFIEPVYFPRFFIFFRYSPLAKPAAVWTSFNMFLPYVCFVSLIWTHLKIKALSVFISLGLLSCSSFFFSWNNIFQLDQVFFYAASHLFAYIFFSIVAASKLALLDYSRSLLTLWA